MFSGDPKHVQLLHLSLTTEATFLRLNMTLYSNLQENPSNGDNWFSDLTLLQIESIPAGYNEVMAVCKHSARNNSPQPTDDTKSKPSH